LPHVCLGKVVTHQRLPDGRYNIMLLGSRRARLVNELPPIRMFREAEVELLDDVYPGEDDAARTELQKELCRRFEKSLPLPNSVKSNAPVKQLLASDLPLGVLTDLASFALPLSATLKQRLLAECDVDCRAHLLLKALGGTAPRSPKAAHKCVLEFPPKFSWN
jgi:Lon protease-like protein